MTKKNNSLLLLALSLGLLGCMQNYGALNRVNKNSILSLNITGPITSFTSQSIIKKVRKYMKEDKIKGLLLRIDSPGGTVAASQEINSTLSEIRNLYKKPVVVSAGDVMASGGVYAAMSADQVIVNKGSLVGSIGVVMVFKNISELVRWAKMDVYYVKAGEFKDSGNPFREMTLRERELFESLLEKVLDQFKESIVQGRGLDPKLVDSIADGRIMTGAEAVELGLADKIGSFNDAIKTIGTLTGLGSTPELFVPMKDNFFTRYLGSDMNSQSLFPHFLNKLLDIQQLSGKPLYILPSYVKVF